MCFTSFGLCICAFLEYACVMDNIQRFVEVKMAMTFCSLFILRNSFMSSCEFSSPKQEVG